MEYSAIIDLLWLTLSGEPDDVYLSAHPDFFSSVDWNELYVFLSGHTIAPLFYDLIKYIPDCCETKEIWKDLTFLNISRYYRLVHQQNHILGAFKRENIPVVVVKGTSAAKYYPKPELRGMGDVDLLVKPEDYDRAVACLISIGCIETSTNAELERGRHRSFLFNKISIELHHFFSSYASADKAEKFDTLTFNAISPEDNMLPEAENGLVLLSHIQQHLKNGLGLRQIIDWFMFVKAYLSDEMWFSSFREKARVTGLESLAITVTRMCQKYLGLTDENITWCKDADEAICDDLMEYVMTCGNFGRSREMLQSSAVEKLPKLSHPIRLFKYIQSHGERNWKVLKKHPYFKPFAWIYQLCRYIKMAFKNKIGAKQIKGIYSEGEKRNKMFDALGIKE